MNDRWIPAAEAALDAALAELGDVQARLAGLPARDPARAALALRAGDLERRIAAASGVLMAYAWTPRPALGTEAPARAAA